MFVIPCKYVKGSPIVDCVKSIHSHHPDERIVVVDSDSDEKEYFSELDSLDCVEILDVKNRYREFGALRESYRKYESESRYVLMHDTVILKRDIEEFISKDAACFMYFPESTIHGSREYEYFKSVLSKTSYESHVSSYLGAFGSMVSVSSSYIKNLESKGLLSTFSPGDKWESQMSERIVGICMLQDGIDLSKSTIEGDFLSRFHQVHSDQLTHFKKVFMGR